MEKVIREKSGIMSANASAEFSSSDSLADLRIHSMMCVPMLGSNGEPIGLINVDCRTPVSQFAQEDLELLMAVAGQVANCYENSRLLEVYIAKQSQDFELAIAHDIQQALLPKRLPDAQGYEFFACYEAAQAVGGDYYGAFRLSASRICFAFGDVAGKGVPGALIMARLASCVESAVKFCPDPVEAVLAVNRQMCSQPMEGHFVTFLLVLIDLTAHEVALVNAGHMSPIVRHSDGSLEEFDETRKGPPIGIVDGHSYEVDSRSLAIGDSIVLYTDGVSDALNPTGERYGMERLASLIQGFRAGTRSLGQAILDDVRIHASGRHPCDDITIITIKRNGLGGDAAAVSST